jgi:hypothetical protein
MSYIVHRAKTFWRFMVKAMLLLSCILLLVFLLALPLDYNSGRTPCTLTGVELWHDVRIGAYGSSYCIFNGIEPYAGSIIEMRHDESSPSRIQYANDWDWPGLHYWYFRFTDGSTYWTLRCSKAYPTCCAAILPAIWLVLRIWRQVRYGVPVHVRRAKVR